MLWAFAQALIMTFADAESRVAYLVMILAMDAVTLLAFSGRVSVGTVLSGTLTCLWLAVKLYNYYAVGELIHPLDYAFIVLPLLGALAAGVFNKGVQSMDTENTLLHRQVEELVLVDEVTGLYNQRALYRDLRIMVHYCDRNHLPISLMLVQMRYGTELEGILSRRQYLELRQRLAELAQNNIRVEDRAYCIDEQGTIALLLTTSEPGQRYCPRPPAGRAEKDEELPGHPGRGHSAGYALCLQAVRGGAVRQRHGGLQARGRERAGV